MITAGGQLRELRVEAVNMRKLAERVLHPASIDVSETVWLNHLSPNEPTATDFPVADKMSTQVQQLHRKRDGSRAEKHHLMP
jgi:hypothetical protein